MDFKFERCTLEERVKYIENLSEEKLAKELLLIWKSSDKEKKKDIVSFKKQKQKDTKGTVKSNTPKTNNA